MEKIPGESQERSGTDLTWVKSSFSYANGNCLEVASLPGGGTGVRDSKNPDGPASCGSPQASGPRSSTAPRRASSTGAAQCDLGQEFLQHEQR